MSDDKVFVPMEKITALLQPGESFAIGEDGSAYGVTDDSVRKLDLSSLKAENAELRSKKDEGSNDG